MTNLPPTVSTEWLAANLDNPNIVVLDSSYHLPNANRDALEEYNQQRIPGAQFFDFDGKIKDRGSAQPHMLPSAEVFSREVEALGITNDSLIVSYDTVGIFSAARCWWMFRCFGHTEVAVLNGGFRKWHSEQRPVESGLATVPHRADTQFETSFQPGLVRSAADVLQELEKTTLLDARAPGRFNGTEAEPRPGLRSGHIPGALNLPFTDVVSKDGTLKAPEDLKAVLSPMGLESASAITASCGSGVTACVLALAFSSLGREDISVYDGSWSEWGADHTLPLQTKN